MSNQDQLKAANVPLTPGEAIQRLEDVRRNLVEDRNHDDPTDEIPARIEAVDLAIRALTMIDEFDNRATQEDAAMCGHCDEPHDIFYTTDDDVDLCEDCYLSLREEMTVKSPEALSQLREIEQQQKDHGAGLIHQTIPDVAGTEPRLTCPNTSTCQEPCEDVDGLSYCLKCGLWQGAR